MLRRFELTIQDAVNLFQDYTGVDFSYSVCPTAQQGFPAANEWLLAPLKFPSRFLNRPGRQAPLRACCGPEWSGSDHLPCRFKEDVDHEKGRKQRQHPSQRLEQVSKFSAGRSGDARWLWPASAFCSRTRLPPICATRQR
jgi:hypothetical protein